MKNKSLNLVDIQRPLELTKANAVPIFDIVGMAKLVNVTLIGLVFLLLHGPAEASPILDQNQSNHGIGVMHRFSTAVLAQSFQQSDNNVAGAGLWVSNYLSGGASATITISLWASLADVGGNPLASGSATHAGNGWVDVFWSPYLVAPGSTMYLVFQSTDGRQGLGGAGNVYSRGNLFANATPNTTYDFAFRTYSGQVPEPSIFLLLLSGLAGIGFTRRSK